MIYRIVGNIRRNNRQKRNGGRGFGPRDFIGTATKVRANVGVRLTVFVGFIPANSVRCREGRARKAKLLRPCGKYRAKRPMETIRTVTARALSVRRSRDDRNSFHGPGHAR